MNVEARRLKEDRKLCKLLAEHARMLEPRHKILPADGIQVSTEKELDDALNSHSYLVRAMPKDRKRLIKAFKKAPRDEEKEKQDSGRRVAEGTR